MKLNQKREYIVLITQIVSVCFLPQSRCECKNNTYAKFMLNSTMKTEQLFNTIKLKAV
jgi:hypothetical protein